MAVHGSPDHVTQALQLLGDHGPAEGGRKRLTAILTRREPGTIPDAAWPSLDAIWRNESAARPVVRASDLPRLAAEGWGARVALWQGDLTTLAIDAIVNAANSGLTGCYTPFHACVDNAIHTAAGPRLREECGVIMTARARPEPTATATLTGGGFLPAKHVLHTVGPIVHGSAPDAEDVALLARCYTSCLDEAARAGLTGVAFCSISTGVFGYPPAAAAPVAIAAVRDRLALSTSVECVVFVAYTARDHALLDAALHEALDG